jgi:hypothetical protein
MRSELTLPLGARSGAMAGLPVGDSCIRCLKCTPLIFRLLVASLSDHGPPGFPTELQDSKRLYIPLFAENDRHLVSRWLYIPLTVP